MTMLITKFHKLIQNKVLWLFFLVMVVLSFVVWGTYTPSQNDARRANAPGALNGKPVDPDGFERARFGEYVSLVLGAGRPLSMTAEVRDELVPLAWRRYVSLQTAEDLGLVASDREVVQSLKDQPIFSEEGRFDPRAYKNFVQGYLGNLLQSNVPLSFFEEHVRHQLSLAKLQHMVRQTVLVAPYDVEQSLHLLADTFEAAYTVVREEDLPGDTEITREQARAHFEKDPAAFTVPPKVRVKYVAFAAADYLDEVTVDPAYVENYYNDHIEDYQVTQTNAVADAAVTNAVTDPEVQTTFRPFEEVREEIEGSLRRQAALNRAMDIAGDFVYELMPDREGNAPDFESMAAERGLALLEPEPFMQTDTLTELGVAAADFVEQAFQLLPNKEEYISNPVEGDEAVYVLALAEQIPERIPAFEEVEAEATRAAADAAREEALVALAREVQETVRTAARDGKPMMEAIADQGLDIVETGTFTVSEGLRDDPYADYLRGEVSALNPGEVSDLVPVFDGILVMQILDRKPADAFALGALGDQVAAGLGDEFAARLYPSWQDQLLADAHFEDFDAARRAALDAELAAEDAAEAEEER